MSATLTTVEDLLKEVYQGSVNSQQNEEAITIKRVEQTAEGITSHIGGQHVVFPLKTGRNQGISYRGENSAMAAAGNQKYKRALEQVKHGYARFAITGPAMDLAESDPQTFMSAFDGEMDGLKDDVVKDSNRIAWGHTDQAANATGIIAKLSAYDSGDPSITVDRPEMVQIDMIIDVINGSTGAVRGTVTVEDVDESTGEIQISATVTGAAANDYIVRTGNWDMEPYGLLGLIGNSGTVHGIDSDAAGFKYWQSQVDGSTTTLTEQAMLTMCDNIRRNGGKKPSAVFCSLGVRRAYYNIMLAQRRYVDPKKFDGGLVGLSFNHGKEIPIVEDPDAPAKHLAMVTESELKVFAKKDWYFEDKDGAILKWKTDYDAFEGFMKKYWQLGTHSRNSHGMFTNITEPTS